MKLVRNILLAIVLLFVAAVAAISWRASSARDADAEFHSGLIRTLSMRSDSFSGGGTIPAHFDCWDSRIGPCSTFRRPCSNSMPASA
jgi:hypothetical protein